MYDSGRVGLGARSAIEAERVEHDSGLDEAEVSLVRPTALK